MSIQLPKQTILHLSTTSGPGGAERVISSLSASLNAGRRRVMVGLFRPGWLQTECERLGVETVIMPLSGPLHLGWFLNCLRLIRRERVALIHAHEFSAIVYGWIVSRLARIPFIGTIHGKNYFWEKARRRAAYQIIARTATLVAVSEDLKRFVVEKIGIPADRIKVIYNGVTPGLPLLIRTEGLWKRLLNTLSKFEFTASNYRYLCRQDRENRNEYSTRLVPCLLVSKGHHCSRPSVFPR